MVDLIDRQAAIDAILKKPAWHGSDGSYYHADDIKQAVQELPTAEPEIILCKDCKHWLDIDDGRQKHRMCADVYGDWFCADAERRIDGVDR